MLIDRADSEGTFLWEELFLYVQAEDEDGESDPALLRLIYPLNSLQWNLSGENLQMIKFQNEIWWGFPDLVMPLGVEFPYGAYLVELEDQAGQVGSMDLFLERTGEENRRKQGPAVSLTGDRIKIDDPKLGDWMLLFYRNKAFFRSEYISSRRAWPLPDELIGGDWELYILHVDNRYLRGWKQGPYRL